MGQWEPLVVGVAVSYLHARQFSATHTEDIMTLARPLLQLVFQIS